MWSYRTQAVETIETKGRAGLSRGLVSHPRRRTHPWSTVLLGAGLRPRLRRYSARALGPACDVTRRGPSGPACDVTRRGPSAPPAALRGLHPPDRARQEPSWTPRSRLVRQSRGALDPAKRESSRRIV